MISRVADQCFWMGRYLERAESTARLLLATRDHGYDTELSQLQCWRPAVVVSGEEPAFVARFGAAALADGEAVQHYLALDEGNYSCIRHSARAARENARAVREVLSLEVWEAVNELYLWIQGAEGQTEFDGRREHFYLTVRKAAQLALGLMRSTMLHDEPLDFVWLGVMLERVSQTARILDVHHHALADLPTHDPVVETALWLSLLRTCSGVEPFMKTRRGRVSPQAVAEFLLLERAFPRSVRYCVSSAYDRLRRVRSPQDVGLPGIAVVERMARLDARMRVLTPRAADREQLHEQLTHVIDEAMAVAVGITREVLGLG